VSKKAAPPNITTLYQHGINVSGYPRDPDCWPPFRAPLFEVTEDPRSGVRFTSCIAIPAPHYPALRRAVAFGLSEAEREAIHAFLRGTDSENCPTVAAPVGGGSAENLTLF